MTSVDGQATTALVVLALVLVSVGLAFWRLGRRVSGAQPLRLTTRVARPSRPREVDADDPRDSHEPSLVRSGPRASSTVSTATRTRTPLADLAARLDPASHLIGATGMVVWCLGADGVSLEVLAGHGYSDAFLTRLGPLWLDQPVLTAAACREGRVRTRVRKGTRLAAIAVPLERDGMTVGVLTAEIDPAAADHVTPEAGALVRLLATQMAPLVAALVPATAHFKPATAVAVAAADVPAAERDAGAAIVQFPSERDRTERTPRSPAPPPDSLSTFEPIPVRVRIESPTGPRAQVAVAPLPVEPAPVQPEPVVAPVAAVPASQPERPAPIAVDDDYDATVREARGRFIAGFRRRCSTIEELIAEVAAKGHEGPFVALRQIVHRLSGLAFVVGLPSVASRAMELDRLIAEPHAAVADLARVRRAFQSMQEGFAADLAKESPSWAAASGSAVGRHVLLVTSDATEAARLVEELQRAGYRVTLIAQGLRAVVQAGIDRPDVVLLDVELSGDLDGHDVCRRLKADTALAEIPVVLLAARTSTADRMAGFALGADDYLAKPVQTVEMLLRVRWTLTRPQADHLPAPRAGGGLMAADAFVAAARDILRQGPAALGLVRAAPGTMPDLSAIISDDLRRKDLLGRYSETQLAVLMPGATAGVAARRIGGVLDVARAAGLPAARAGVTATGLSADRFVEPLLAEAESALASAQVEGTPVVVYGAGPTSERGSVLIVDDDPDVVHVIDARLKAAGLHTLVAFDGQQALHQVETSAPSVIVLELMLPKRSGFDVLARLRDLPEPRPRVVILSARSREEDVMRAFELGADDYLTKPFNPQELLARLGRLLK